VFFCSVVLLVCCLWSCCLVLLLLVVLLSCGLVACGFVALSCLCLCSCFWLVGARVGPVPPPLLASTSSVVVSLLASIRLVARSRLPDGSFSLLDSARRRFYPSLSGLGLSSSSWTPPSGGFPLVPSLSGRGSSWTPPSGGFMGSSCCRALPWTPPAGGLTGSSLRRSLLGLLPREVYTTVPSRDGGVTCPSLFASSVAWPCSRCASGASGPRLGFPGGVLARAGRFLVSPRGSVSLLFWTSPPGDFIYRPPSGRWGRPSFSRRSLGLSGCLLVAPRVYLGHDSALHGTS
jgi:hypothetical protein